MPIKTKTCSRCKKEKEISQFIPDKSKPDGYKYLCRDCYKTYCDEYRKKNRKRLTKYHREYRKKNPEKNKASRKRYYTNNILKVRDYDMRKNYGITLLEYNEMFEKQKGLCAICKKSEKIKPRLSIDHCHKTNKVRGLLCDKCNNGIARFNDDVQLLKNAIEYLK